MGTSTPTFEVRDGEDWVTWTTQTGDTTSDKVSRIKERPEEWKIAGPQYDAWKADAKAQKEAKAADEARAKDAAEKLKTPAEPESVRAEKAKAEAEAKAKDESLVPDDDDEDDDDDKAASKGAGKMRAPFTKGYRK